MEDKTCCCHKTKERTEEEVKKLLNRLSRIEGQIRGIRGMVEKNAYCTDILVQSAAVSAAMNAFNRDLLANHIRTCVVTDIRDGKEDALMSWCSPQKLMNNAPSREILILTAQTRKGSTRWNNSM
ncbi:MAG: metal-sensing transcriptional repressor [Evtepia gabavorous]